MSRKKGTTAEEVPTTTDAPAEQPANGQAPEGVSKAQAIREAIGFFGGPDKMPEAAAVIKWVQDKYGLEVTPSYVSIEKGKLKQGTGGKKGRKPKKAAPAVKAASPAVKATANGLVDELLAVKALADRLGRTEFMRLVERFF
jgi:hypothetical protein